MPSRKSRATFRALEVVQRLKNGIKDTNSLCVTHRLLVDSRDGSTPLAFTIDVFREPRGMFVATCRQLPLVLVAGETEEDALTKAETDIRFLFAARDAS